MLLTFISCSVKINIFSGEAIQKFLAGSTVIIILVLITSKILLQKTKFSDFKKLTITETLNFVSCRAMIMAFYYLKDSFKCSLVEPSAFGQKKTTFLCFFTNFLISRLIIIIGIFAILTDSLVMLVAYILKIRSNTLQLNLRLTSSDNNVSPKTAVRKAWATKFAETSV